jgi:hypothetical protein
MLHGPAPQAIPIITYMSKVAIDALGVQLRHIKCRLEGSVRGAQDRVPKILDAVIHMVAMCVSDCHLRNDAPIKRSYHCLIEYLGCHAHTRRPGELKRAAYETVKLMETSDVIDSAEAVIVAVVAWDNHKAFANCGMGLLA